MHLVHPFDLLRVFCVYIWIRWLPINFRFSVPGIPAILSKQLSTVVNLFKNERHVGFCKNAIITENSSILLFLKRFYDIKTRLRRFRYEMASLSRNSEYEIPGFKKGTWEKYKTFKLNSKSKRTAGKKGKGDRYTKYGIIWIIFWNRISCALFSAKTITEKEKKILCGKDLAHLESVSFKSAGCRPATNPFKVGRKRIVVWIASFVHKFHDSLL